MDRIWLQRSVCPILGFPICYAPIHVARSSKLRFVVWRLHSWSPLKSVPAAVISLDLNPQDSLLATGSGDSVARICMFWLSAYCCSMHFLPTYCRALRDDPMIRSFHFLLSFAILTLAGSNRPNTVSTTDNWYELSIQNSGHDTIYLIVRRFSHVALCTN
jgi:hypothetical protein